MDTGSASVSWFAGAAPGKRRAGLRLLCFLAPHLWFCLAEPLSYFFPHLLGPLVCPPRGCLREPLQCQVPRPVWQRVGPPPDGWLPSRFWPPPAPFRTALLPCRSLCPACPFLLSVQPGPPQVLSQLRDYFLTSSFQSGSFVPALSHSPSKYSLSTGCALDTSQSAGATAGADKPRPCPWAVGILVGDKRNRRQKCVLCQIPMPVGSKTNQGGGQGESLQR